MSKGLETWYEQEEGENTFAVKFKTEGKKKGIEPVLGADGEMLTDAERRQKAPFFSLKILNAISLVISSLENYLKIEKQKETWRELQPR